MLKTLDRYIFREISTTWFAVTVVLLVIMVANILARILSKVTDGSLPADALLTLVGLKVISLLVTLIPLGLYLGVLLGFGRMYRDSEMSALAACGTGLSALYRPVVANGVIGVLIIAVLTFWASPWAARYEQRLMDEVADQSITSLLGAGRFIEIPGGNAVVFTEALSEDKQQFKQIFVHRELENGAFEIETARSANYRKDPASGDEYVVFVDGTSIVVDANHGSYRRTEFARHGVRLPSKEQQASSLEYSAQTLGELLRTRDNPSIAEIQWRISIPLAAMLLAILAVPLAHSSPRQGRYSKIALAILIYVPYANLLVLSRKWLAAGTVSPVVGLWWVHLLFICLIAFLTIRHYGYRWVFGRHSAPVVS